MRNKKRNQINNKIVDITAIIFSLCFLLNGIYYLINGNKFFKILKYGLKDFGFNVNSIFAYNSNLGIFAISPSYFNIAILPIIVSVISFILIFFIIKNRIKLTKSFDNNQYSVKINFVSKILYLFLFIILAISFIYTSVATMPLTYGSFTTYKYKINGFFSIFYFKTKYLIGNYDFSENKSFVFEPNFIFNFDANISSNIPLLYLLLSTKYMFCISILFIEFIIVLVKKTNIESLYIKNNESYYENDFLEKDNLISDKTAEIIYNKAKENVNKFNDEYNYKVDKTIGLYIDNVKCKTMEIETKEKEKKKSRDVNYLARKNKIIKGKKSDSIINDVDFDADYNVIESEKPLNDFNNPNRPKTLGQILGRNIKKDNLDYLKISEDESNIKKYASPNAKLENVVSKKVDSEQKQVQLLKNLSSLEDALERLVVQNNEALLLEEQNPDAIEINIPNLKVNNNTFNGNIGQSWTGQHITGENNFDEQYRYSIEGQYPNQNQELYQTNLQDVQYYDQYGNPIYEYTYDQYGYPIYLEYYDQLGQPVYNYLYDQYGNIVQPINSEQSENNSGQSENIAFAQKSYDDKETIKGKEGSEVSDDIDKINQFREKNKEELLELERVLDEDSEVFDQNWIELNKEFDNPSLSVQFNIDDFIVDEDVDSGNESEIFNEEDFYTISEDDLARTKFFNIELSNIRKDDIKKINVTNDAESESSFVVSDLKEKELKKQIEKAHKNSIKKISKYFSGVKYVTDEFWLDENFYNSKNAKKDFQVKNLEVSEIEFINKEKESKGFTQYYVNAINDVINNIRDDKSYIEFNFDEFSAFKGSNEVQKIFQKLTTKKEDVDINEIISGKYDYTFEVGDSNFFRKFYVDDNGKLTKTKNDLIYALSENGEYKPLNHKFEYFDETGKEYADPSDRYVLTNDNKHKKVIYKFIGVKRAEEKNVLTAEDGTKYVPFFEDDSKNNKYLVNRNKIFIINSDLSALKVNHELNVELDKGKIEPVADRQLFTRDKDNNIVKVKLSKFVNYWSSPEKTFEFRKHLFILDIDNKYVYVGNDELYTRSIDNRFVKVDMNMKYITATNEVLIADQNELYVKKDLGYLKVIYTDFSKIILTKEKFESEINKNSISDKTIEKVQEAIYKKGTINEDAKNEILSSTGVGLKKLNEIIQDVSISSLIREHNPNNIEVKEVNEQLKPIPIYKDKNNNDVFVEYRQLKTRTNSGKIVSVDNTLSYNEDDGKLTTAINNKLYTTAQNSHKLIPVKLKPGYGSIDSELSDFYIEKFEPFYFNEKNILVSANKLKIYAKEDNNYISLDKKFEYKYGREIKSGPLSNCYFKSKYGFGPVIFKLVKYKIKSGIFFKDQISDIKPYYISEEGEELLANNKQIYYLDQNKYTQKANHSYIWKNPSGNIEYIVGQDSFIYDDKENQITVRWKEATIDYNKFIEEQNQDNLYVFYRTKFGELKWVRNADKIYINNGTDYFELIDDSYYIDSKNKKVISKKDASKYIKTKKGAYQKVVIKHYPFASYKYREVLGHESKVSAYFIDNDGNKNVVNENSKIYILDKSGNEIELDNNFNYVNKKQKIVSGVSKTAYIKQGDIKINIQWFMDRKFIYGYEKNGHDYIVEKTFYKENDFRFIRNKSQKFFVNLRGRQLGENNNDYGYYLLDNELQIRNEKGLLYTAKPEELYIQIKDEYFKIYMLDVFENESRVDNFDLLLESKVSSNINNEISLNLEKKDFKNNILNLDEQNYKSDKPKTYSERIVLNSKNNSGKPRPLFASIYLTPKEDVTVGDFTIDKWTDKKFVVDDNGLKREVKFENIFVRGLDGEIFKLKDDLTYIDSEGVKRELEINTEVLEYNANKEYEHVDLEIEDQKPIINTLNDGIVIVDKKNELFVRGNLSSDRDNNLIHLDSNYSYVDKDGNTIKVNDYEEMIVVTLDGEINAAQAKEIINSEPYIVKKPEEKLTALINGVITDIDKENDRLFVVNERGIFVPINKKDNTYLSIKGMYLSAENLPKYIKQNNLFIPVIRKELPYQKDFFYLDKNNEMRIAPSDRLFTLDSTNKYVNVDKTLTYIDSETNKKIKAAESDVYVKDPDGNFINAIIKDKYNTSEPCYYDENNNIYSANNKKLYIKNEDGSYNALNSNLEFVDKFGKVKSAYNKKIYTKDINDRFVEIFWSDNQTDDYRNIVIRKSRYVTDEFGHPYDVNNNQQLYYIDYNGDYRKYITDGLYETDHWLYKELFVKNTSGTFVPVFNNLKIPVIVDENGNEVIVKDRQIFVSEDSDILLPVDKNFRYYNSKNKLVDANSKKAYILDNHGVYVPVDWRDINIKEMLELVYNNNHIVNAYYKDKNNIERFVNSENIMIKDSSGEFVKCDEANLHGLSKEYLNSSSLNLFIKNSDDTSFKIYWKDDIISYVNLGGRFFPAVDKVIFVIDSRGKYVPVNRRFQYKDYNGEYKDARRNELFTKNHLGAFVNAFWSSINEMVSYNERHSFKSVESFILDKNNQLQPFNKTNIYTVTDNGDFVKVNDDLTFVNSDNQLKRVNDRESFGKTIDGKYIPILWKGSALYYVAKNGQHILINSFQNLYVLNKANLYSVIDLNNTYLEVDKKRYIAQGLNKYVKTPMDIFVFVQWQSKDIEINVPNYRRRTFFYKDADGNQIYVNRDELYALNDLDQYVKVNHDFEITNSNNEKENVLNAQLFTQSKFGKMIPLSEEHLIPYYLNNENEKILVKYKNLFIKTSDNKLKPINRNFKYKNENSELVLLSNEVTYIIGNNGLQIPVKWIKSNEVKDIIKRIDKFIPCYSDSAGNLHEAIDKNLFVLDKDNNYIKVNEEFEYIDSDGKTLSADNKQLYVLNDRNIKTPVIWKYNDSKPLPYIYDSFGNESLAINNDIYVLDESGDYYKVDQDMLYLNSKNNLESAWNKKTFIKDQFNEWVPVIWKKPESANSIVNFELMYKNKKPYIKDIDNFYYWVSKNDLYTYNTNNEPVLVNKDFKFTDSNGSVILVSPDNLYAKNKSNMLEKVSWKTNKVAPFPFFVDSNSKEIIADGFKLYTKDMNGLPIEIDKNKKFIDIDGKVKTATKDNVFIKGKNNGLNKVYWKNIDWVQYLNAKIIQEAEKNNLENEIYNFKNELVEKKGEKIFEDFSNLSVSGDGQLFIDNPNKNSSYNLVTSDTYASKDLNELENILSDKFRKEDTFISEQSNDDSAPILKQFESNREVVKHEAPIIIQQPLYTNGQSPLVPQPLSIQTVQPYLSTDQIPHQQKTIPQQPQPDYIQTQPVYSPPVKPESINNNLSPIEEETHKLGQMNNHQPWCDYGQPQPQQMYTPNEYWRDFDSKVINSPSILPSYIPMPIYIPVIGGLDTVKRALRYKDIQETQRILTEDPTKIFNEQQEELKKPLTDKQLDNTVFSEVLDEDDFNKNKTIQEPASKFNNLGVSPVTINILPGATNPIQFQDSNGQNQINYNYPYPNSRSQFEQFNNQQNLEQQANEEKIDLSKFSSKSAIKDYNALLNPGLSIDETITENSNIIRRTNHVKPSISKLYMDAVEGIDYTVNNPTISNNPNAVSLNDFTHHSSVGSINPDDIAVNKNSLDKLSEDEYKHFDNVDELFDAPLIDANEETSDFKTIEISPYSDTSGSSNNFTGQLIEEDIPELTETEMIDQTIINPNVPESIINSKQYNKLVLALKNKHENNKKIGQLEEELTNKAISKSETKSINKKIDLLRKDNALEDNVIDKAVKRLKRFDVDTDDIIKRKTNELLYNDKIEENKNLKNEINNNINSKSLNDIQTKEYEDKFISQNPELIKNDLDKTIDEFAFKNKNIEKNKEFLNFRNIQDEIFNNKTQQFELKELLANEDLNKKQNKKIKNQLNSLEKDNNNLIKKAEKSINKIDKKGIDSSLLNSNIEKLKQDSNGLLSVSDFENENQQLLEPINHLLDSNNLNDIDSIKDEQLVSNEINKINSNNQKISNLSERLKDLNISEYEKNDIKRQIGYYESENKNLNDQLAEQTLKQFSSDADSLVDISDSNNDLQSITSEINSDISKLNTNKNIINAIEQSINNPNISDDERRNLEQEKQKVIEDNQAITSRIENNSQILKEKKYNIDELLNNNDNNSVLSDENSDIIINNEANLNTSSLPVYNANYDIEKYKNTIEYKNIHKDCKKISDNINQLSVIDKRLIEEDLSEDKKEDLLNKREMILSSSNLLISNIKEQRDILTSKGFETDSINNLINDYEDELNLLNKPILENKSSIKSKEFKKLISNKELADKEKEEIFEIKNKLANPDISKKERNQLEKRLSSIQLKEKILERDIEKNKFKLLKSGLNVDQAIKASNISINEGENVDDTKEHQQILSDFESLNSNINKIKNIKAMVDDPSLAYDKRVELLNQIYNLKENNSLLIDRMEYNRDKLSQQGFDTTNAKIIVNDSKKINDTISGTNRIDESVLDSRSFKNILVNEEKINRNNQQIEELKKSLNNEISDKDKKAIEAKIKSLLSETKKSEKEIDNSVHKLEASGVPVEDVFINKNLNTDQKTIKEVDQLNYNLSSQNSLNNNDLENSEKDLSNENIQFDTDSNYNEKEFNYSNEDKKEESEILSNNSDFIETNMQIDSDKSDDVNLLDRKLLKSKHYKKYLETNEKINDNKNALIEINKKLSLSDISDKEKSKLTKQASAIESNIKNLNVVANNASEKLLSKGFDIKDQLKPINRDIISPVNLSTENESVSSKLVLEPSVDNFNSSYNNYNLNNNLENEESKDENNKPSYLNSPSIADALTPKPINELVDKTISFTPSRSTNAESTSEYQSILSNANKLLKNNEKAKNIRSKLSKPDMTESEKKLLVDENDQIINYNAQLINEMKDKNNDLKNRGFETSKINNLIKAHELLSNQVTVPPITNDSVFESKHYKNIVDAKNQKDLNENKLKDFTEMLSRKDLDKRERKDLVKKVIGIENENKNLDNTIQKAGIKLKKEGVDLNQVITSISEKENAEVFEHHATSHYNSILSNLVKIDENQSKVSQIENKLATTSNLSKQDIDVLLYEKNRLNVETNLLKKDIQSNRDELVDMGSDSHELDREINDSLIRSNTTLEHKIEVDNNVFDKFDTLNANLEINHKQQDSKLEESEISSDLHTQKTNISESQNQKNTFELETTPQPIEPLQNENLQNNFNENNLYDKLNKTLQLSNQIENKLDDEVEPQEAYLKSLEFNKPVINPEPLPRDIRNNYDPNYNPALKPQNRVSSSDIINKYLPSGAKTSGQRFNTKKYEYKFANNQNQSNQDVFNETWAVPSFDNKNAKRLKPISNRRQVPSNMIFGNIDDDNALMMQGFDLGIDATGRKLGNPNNKINRRFSSESKNLIPSNNHKVNENQINIKLKNEVENKIDKISNNSNSNIIKNSQLNKLVNKYNRLRISGEITDKNLNEINKNLLVAYREISQPDLKLVNIFDYIQSQDVSKQPRFIYENSSLISQVKERYKKAFQSFNLREADECIKTLYEVSINSEDMLFRVGSLIKDKISRANLSSDQINGLTQLLDEASRRSDVNTYRLTAEKLLNIIWN